MDSSNQEIIDQEQWSTIGLNYLGYVSCTTFNILAPIYKRLNGKSCESDFREYWLSRNESILERLLHLKSSIICLQVYKILQYIESYCEEQCLSPVPIILCGDWNGSKKGHVYKFLRSQGFVSSYDVAHHYTDNDEDSHKWISHRNHRGNVCGVDFIWLLNPNKHRKPLKESFMEAALGNMKNLLHKVSTEGGNTLHFLKTDGDHITYSQFSQFLDELGLCENPHEGVSDEDIKELWECLVTDRDGVVDLSHFTSSRNLHSEQKEENEESGVQMKENFNISTSSTMIGFNVKKAALFPPEVEKGMWPENYSLSDHAHLTVEFSPVKMQSS